MKNNLKNRIQAASEKTKNNLFAMGLISASSVDEIFTPMNKLKDLLLAGCVAMGVIVIIIAIIMFAIAFASHNSEQKINAIPLFITGVLLLSAGVVLNFLIT